MIQGEGHQRRGLTADGAFGEAPDHWPLFDAVRHWAAKFEKINSEIEDIEDQLDAAQRSLTKES